MSKVFEALQRLERDSGQLPPGVLAEAQELFKNGAPEAVSATPVESIGPALDQPASIPKVNRAPINSEPVPPVFSLSQVPVEEATIAERSRIVYYTDPNGAGADRFRLLRMRLRPVWESGKLRTLLITSAQAQDGKSTVVLNFATALAEQGKKNVLVIEGDLYHPTLAERLGLPNRAGLAECLEAEANPLSLLRRIEPVGWYLLSAGVPQGNPTELFQSPTLSNVFAAFRQYFDWILIDTPPVVPLSDTLSLRQHADAALLVVRADRTPQSAVEAAIGRVGPQHLLGVILNGAEDLEQAYADYRKSYGVKKSKKRFGS